MDAEHTPHQEIALLRETLTRVSIPDLKSALDQAIRPEYQAPKAVRNALGALRRHHDPVPYLSRPQYRSTIPFLAAVLTEECLNRTIELLGDNSEEPTRGQLLEALETIHEEFPDPIVAVMLAAVAYDGLPASELCEDLLTTDSRYGLADEGSGAPTSDAADAADAPDVAAPVAQDVPELPPQDVPEA